MSAMTIDDRSTVNIKTFRAIEAAYDAMIEAMDCDGRYDQKTRRKYLRLIRSVSGVSFVTTHQAEHNPMNNPPTMTIAFGRCSQ